MRRKPLQTPPNPAEHPKKSDEMRQFVSQQAVGQKVKRELKLWAVNVLRVANDVQNRFDDPNGLKLNLQPRRVSPTIPTVISFKSGSICRA